ncbi:MAG: cell envelope integrity protein TolA, partial [Lautropia sp.]|nr:cell envelope integrity protein TolA [Lautropia sp.]
MAHDDRSDQRRSNRGTLSFLLALLVHVGLLALLFVGISWQKPQPEVVQAELWIPVEALPEAAQPAEPAPQQPEPAEATPEPEPQPAPPPEPAAAPPPPP